MNQRSETTVSSLADACAALAAAAREGRAATLVGDAASGGAGWFRALVEAARRQCPGGAVTAILECHDQPGLVMAGIRAGVGDLRFSGPPEIAARLEALAAAAGARLHAPSGARLHRPDTDSPA